jgi:3-phenylpropionate/trans-cinnamate dioxygenase ferredoxin subunit
MAFERVCALDEIQADQALAITVGRYDLAIARDGDEVFAVEDMCSHADVALSQGEVVCNDGGCQIECWMHGSMFDLRTGKPTNLPATEPVATFPVDVRANPNGTSDVYVDTETTLNGVTPA